MSLIHKEEENARQLERLKKDVPPDAGKPYKCEDGLIKYLENQKPDYIREIGIWIKMHYTETENILERIRKLYQKKRKEK